MGYALPSGVLNTNSLRLYPVSPVVTLGPYVKHVADQTLVVLDYSGLTPSVTLTDYAFAVDVSTNPQLVISFPNLDSTGKVLSFLLSGGIVEQQYRITINIHSDAAARTDTLVINIPSSGSDCAVVQPVPAIYNQLPLWGGGYVNSAVRAFWGAVAPANPNVMDQWFNTTNELLYEWMTDGETAEWVIIYSPDYLLDAPHNSVLYGRLNTSWSPVPISEIQTDAPDDGSYYARKSHAWAAVPRIPQPSDTPPLMDAPVPVPGASIDFARIDHVHPTDSTLYSASNPAGYQTAGNVTATLQTYMPLSGGVFQGAVSFLAAGLFASPNNIQIGGGNANYVLSTNGAGALSWVPPTVGISDAPVDTQTYARNHGNWVNITTATGVPEAPNDGQLWGRESLTWVQIPVGGGSGIPDAPNDATLYSRQNGAWRHITHNDITDWALTLAPYALTSNIPAGSTTTPLVDASSPSTGTDATWARADHVHPTDTSRYSASNPANYIPDALNDGTMYGRKSAAWSHLTHNDITDWTASTIPVVVSSTAPSGPQAGWLWWRTTDQQLYVYSGTAWVIAVSPAVIPDAPNNGVAYARRSLSWSTLTHNDITDWAATLSPYLLKSGGTMTGPLNGTTFAMSGNCSLTGTLSVIGAGGGASAYIGFFDGPGARNGYFGQFGATGLVWQYESPSISINLNSNGNIYLNGPVQCSTITATGVIHSNSDITAGGNMSCGTMFSQLNTGGSVTAGYLHSTGSSQIDGNEQVNGNFNCSNTVSGYTGNFSYSTIYGNLTVNNQITCQQYAQFNNSMGVHGTLNVDTLTVNGSCRVTQSFGAQGIVSRNGISGSWGGNQYNFYWNGSQNHLYLNDSDWGVIQTVSDYRLKKDIEPLGSMWGTVRALNPISYTHKDWTPPSGGPSIIGDDIEHWGFLAHELQETLVESAANGVKDDPVHVQSPNPFTVIAALTKALQEAMMRIEALEARSA